MYIISRYQINYQETKPCLKRQNFNAGNTGGKKTQNQNQNKNQNENKQTKINTCHLFSTEYRGS